MGLGRWWLPRALAGAVRRRGADVALLLSGSPCPAPFFSGSVSLCAQEVGEKVLQSDGPLNEGR